MSRADITTDYLVVGGGMNGLAFVDELLTRTNAHITLVDQRDLPGGHWLDSYPHVRLHQPSTFYGVESTELSDYRYEQYGLNKGYLKLASKPEILHYCQKLMEDRFLPSGRVKYLPSTEYLPDGSLRVILSGKRLTVKIQKKLVDATWYTNSIPLTHKRPFAVDAAVCCAPPNELPLRAKDFTNFTVLGAGKTGIDACTWLLSNGTDPDRIRWIIPSDYWYVDRAKFQPTHDYFIDNFTTFADVRDHIAEATNATDLALRHEKTGLWFRLDPTIFPTAFHGANVSTAEMEQLRSIKNVVRKGHVTHITPTILVLTKGSDASPESSLYIDCSASALRHRPLVPIFQSGKIVLQMVRFPLIPFSAAMTAFVESLQMEDSERNSFMQPVPFRRTVDDYLFSLERDYMNRHSANKHKEVRAWMMQSRLDGVALLAASVKPDEKEKIALLMRLRKSNEAAMKNLPTLRATSGLKATL